MYVDNGYIVSAFVRRPAPPPHPEAPNPAATVVERSLARGMSNEKYQLLKKADDHRKELQEKTSKAMDTPEMRVQNEAKTRAREKLKAIVEKLKILKKLFSGNAKEMARAMTQVFKELKAALKEFKEAGKAQMDAVASSAASIVPPMTAGATAPARPEGDAKAVEAEGKTAETAANTVSHDELMGSMRRSLGEDGMEFLKELKGILKHIDEKMLAPARIQKAAQKSDEDTDKVFEDMDKELKDLRKAMADMERDLKHDAPETGMVLDMRA
jgi:hypothetical protein